MKTNHLIALLSADAPARHNLTNEFHGAVVAAVVLVAAVFFSAIGFRPDIDVALGSGKFLFKFLVTGSLAASSFVLLIGMSRPGVELRTRGLWLLLPVALITTAVVVELMTMPSVVWESRMIGHKSRLCLTVIPLLSLLPLTCFLYAMRLGAPSKPALAGAVAGLASAGIAATFYAANCTDDSPLFVMLWYPIAISMVAALGALVGARTLRW